MEASVLLLFGTYMGILARECGAAVTEEGEGGEERKFQCLLSSSLCWMYEVGFSILADDEMRGSPSRVRRSENVHSFLN